MYRLRLATAVLALPVAVLVAGSVPAAASGEGGNGQCTVNIAGQWVTVQCDNNGSNGGGGGSGQTTVACVFSQLSKAQATAIGLPWPPPAGLTWVLMLCPVTGDVPGPMAILLSTATGAPQVTPQQLLQQALGQLEVPTLTPGFAPPPGKDGLVGLPEWFWVPSAAWHELSVTVRAGPVWATATATPERLTYEPGGGLGAVSCAGPGTAYDPARPAAQQHTRCSYTYEQSSAGQPRHAYQASVIVSWRVAWAGSGGTGGVLNADLPVPYSLALPVAQGEALVSSP